MFTFSKATSEPQSRPSLRFKTFNGWTGTMERVRALGAPNPPAKPRKATPWLRRGNNRLPIQSVEGELVSPPLPLNYPPLPLVVGPMSSRPAGTTLPPGLGSFCCTKMVLVASSDPLRPCRIRRINTRKEHPWLPISKPLPPLPSPPAIHDSAAQPSTASYLSPTTSSSYSSNPTSRNPLEETFDDGLDDLSLFLRRIAYDVISASTIHRHLGYMEDGGRVLPLGGTRSSHRNVSAPKRYSSLMGVSLAIMEGRLPKALMVM
jgi:hypothetical protein